MSANISSCYPILCMIWVLSSTRCHLVLHMIHQIHSHLVKLTGVLSFGSHKVVTTLYRVDCFSLSQIPYASSRSIRDMEFHCGMLKYLINFCPRSLSLNMEDIQSSFLHLKEPRIAVATRRKAFCSVELLKFQKCFVSYSRNQERKSRQWPLLAPNPSTGVCIWQEPSLMISEPTLPPYQLNMSTSVCTVTSSSRCQAMVGEKVYLWLGELCENPKTIAILLACLEVNIWISNQESLGIFWTLFYFKSSFSCSQEAWTLFAWPAVLSAITAGSICS